MSRKAAVRLGWTLWVSALGLAALTIALSVLNMVEERSFSTGELTFICAALAFSMPGALIVSRHPQHVVGWIFCAVGLLLTVSSLVFEYGTFALLTAEGRWPLGREVAGLGAIGAAAFAIMAGPLLLLFPTGKLVTPRLKPLLAVGWSGAALSAVTEALLVERLGPPLDAVSNPYRIDGSAAGFIEAANVLGLGFVLLASMSGAVSLIYRFRRASGAERQQVKWMAYAASIFVVFWIVTIAADGTGFLNQDFLDVLLFLPFAALPAAATIAILRYRLYDIDRIINRTLVYGLLTAGLGLIYFGFVVGLQELLQPVSGGSDLAIVVTTLVVAALFLPARRRVQRIVDRRFNRHTYDAQRTIDAFSARLREQIDLDTLRYELLAVVDETMQPSTAGVWLRQGEGR